MVDIPGTGDEQDGDRERPDGAPSGPGAGGSAAAEAERLAALSAHYAEDAAKWARGADGERRTAEQLNSLGPGFVVLHDLHVPGSDANVDHLVVGPAGVFVVDSKAYSGPFSERAGTLWSGQHPVRREVDTVEFIASRVAVHLGVPVRTVLCFTDAPLPRPVVQLGATVGVGLDGVRDTVGGSRRVLSDAEVERIGRRAEELRSPVERPAAADPDLGTPGGSGTRPAPPRQKQPAPKRSGGSPAQPTSRQSRGSRSTPSVKGLVFRLVVLVVGLVFVLPAVLHGCKGSRAALPAAPSTADSSPTTAAPTAPAVTLQFSCPAPGQGYTATFVWPAGVERSWVQVTVSAGGTRLLSTYWTKPDLPPKPLTGIAPGTSTDVTTKSVARMLAKPTQRVATAPAAPC